MAEAAELIPEACRASFSGDGSDRADLPLFELYIIIVAVARLKCVQGIDRLSPLRIELVENLSLSHAITAELRWVK